MRAVLYARVSSNDRLKTGGENLQAQLKLCRDYAESIGHTVIAELFEDDRGVSGAELYPPQLSKALEMARAGQYDVLIIREFDRLARNITKQYIIEAELESAGVKIDYVLYNLPETIEGGLQKGIYATFAEYERKKIQQRMIRGRYRKITNGEVMCHGHPPYGYKEIEVDGKRQLVPHETEAAVVKMLFQLYTEGDGNNGPYTLAGLKKHLDNSGIPSPGVSNPDRYNKTSYTKTWRIGSISEIMRRESYIGKWEYGKNSDNPITVDIPPLISRDIYDKARAQARKNDGLSKRKTKYNYLLRRRVSCSCGFKMKCNAMGGGKRLYYACGSRWNDAPEGTNNCTMPYIRAEQVDAFVWDWLKAKFSDESALIEALNEQAIKRDELTRPQRDNLATIEKLLKDKKHELVKLLDLYLTGDFPRELLTERKKKIDNEIYGYEAQQSRLQSILDEESLGEERIKTLLELTHYVRNGMVEAENDFKKRRWVIDTLDVKATLAIENNEKVVYMSCMAGNESVLFSSDYSQSTSWNIHANIIHTFP